MPADTGVNVAENATAVGTFAGSDIDAGQILTYTLSGADAGLFEIVGGNELHLSAGATLDFEIAAGGLMTPEPYSAELDVSAAVPGSVMAILAQGDTGLADDPGEFATFSVVVLS